MTKVIGVATKCERHVLVQERERKADPQQRTPWTPWSSPSEDREDVSATAATTAAIAADDSGEEALAALITRILLDHFGDGRPVHADVVMDTVQYRLSQEETIRWRANEADGHDYSVWADRRVSSVYHQCLLRLVSSGHLRVMYDCGGGCDGRCDGQEQDDSLGRERRCQDGRDGNNCDGNGSARL